MESTSANATEEDSYSGPTKQQKKITGKVGEGILSSIFFVQKNRLEESAKKILNIRNALGTPRVSEIEAIVANLYLQADRIEAAEKLLQPYTRSRTEGKFNEHLKRCFLVDGLIKLKQGKPNKAMKVLDWVTENARPGLVRVRAAMGVGQALMDASRYRGAVKAYNFALDALNYLNKLSDQYANEDYDPQQTGDQKERSLTAIRATREGDLINWYRAKKGKRAVSKRMYHLLRQSIKGQLSSARRRLKIKRFGEDYVLFKEAEKLRHKGNYRKAKQKYDNVIAEFGASGSHKRENPSKQDTVNAPGKSEPSKKQNEQKNKEKSGELKGYSAYVTPSRLYRAVCLKELGELDRAALKLKQFYRRKPLGKYRGQALLELALIHTVERLKPFPTGQKYFKKLDNWLNDVRNHPDLDMLSMIEDEEATGKIRPPQTEYRGTDFWGKTRKSQVRPGQLVNRETMPWLLSDLEERCVKFRGMLQLVKGNRKKAMKLFRRLPELDDEMSTGRLASNPNDYTRLKFGANHGYLVAKPSTLKKYGKNLRFPILLGDFYYVTRRYDRAIQLMQRLLNGEITWLSKEQRDYPKYLCARSWTRKGNQMKALTYYRKILKHRDETPVEIKARYLGGKIAVHDEGKRRKWGLNQLRTLASSKIDNKYVYLAQIKLARVLHREGKKEVAIQILKDVPEKAGGYETIAREFLNKFKTKK